MTISAAVRGEDAQRALLLLLERVGDRGIDEEDANIEDPPFNELLKTTWATLERRGYVKDIGQYGPKHYQLTEEGWLKALALSDQPETPEFTRRVQVLLQALKRAVDERSGDGLLDVREIASNTGLPLGWVWNGARAQLLDFLYPGRGYALEMLDGVTVRVPADFGHEPIDI